jgi:phospholipid/cholesterol/gamma-HCH transport system ATP-binding protein
VVRDIFKKTKAIIKPRGELARVPYMIELKNITKNFNGHRVLNGTDLRVEGGKTIAVIGPSGCGKSTLLRLILGLFPPTSGKIFIAGEDITGLDEDEMNEIRQHLGMVFQSSALFDSLTVGENVAFGLREHFDLGEKEILEIVSEKLELVGLKGTEALMPSELSGGMQKRIGLARAIATNPEIILYDEPTTGLDPITAVAIEHLIKELHKKFNITAIVVTHMLSTVYHIADRIAMLHEGKIIEAGTPEETKLSLNPIIKEFVSAGAGP